MGITAIVRRGQAASDTGAAAVEFALLLPVFVMLVFGMISGGLTFNRWIETTQAAREASRFGATLPISSESGGVNAWLTTITDVAKDSAGITSSTPESDYLVCVRFVNRVGPNATPPTTRNDAFSTGTLGGFPAANTCTDSTINDNVVEVLIRRKATFEWIFGGGDVSVSGTNTSRYEPVLKTVEPG